MDLAVDIFAIVAASALRRETCIMKDRTGQKKGKESQGKGCGKARLFIPTTPQNYRSRTSEGFKAGCCIYRMAGVALRRVLDILGHGPRGRSVGSGLDFSGSR